MRAESQSSFHTWSATSSPDQSPDASESALHTPPPTNLSQDDRFGTAQNAVLQLPETPYESEISPSPEMIHCGRNIYNHRSYSLPSFLSANSVPTSPQAPEYSSHNVPTSLSGNLVDEFSALAEAKLVPPGYFSAPAPERKISAAYLSSHCDITLHDQELSQRSVESGTFFDVSTHHGHQVPEMHLSQRQVSVHTADKSSVPLFGDHSYDVRQYMEGKYSTNSSPLSASDSSGAGHAVDAYSAWLAQIHANGAFSPSSDSRTDTSLNASIQNIYSASTHRSDYSSFEMMSQDAEPYAGISRARPSNTLGCNSPSVTRQYPGMMLQNLPAPRFSHNQWVNGPAPPPPNGSYPSSANPSPSACSTCSFPEWAQ